MSEANEYGAFFAATPDEYEGLTKPIIVDIGQDDNGIWFVSVVSAVGLLMSDNCRDKRDAEKVARRAVRLIKRKLPPKTTKASTP